MLSAVLRSSLVVIALLSMSCETSPDRLIVELSTDMVAGVDYDAITVRGLDRSLEETFVIGREEIGTRYLESPRRVELIFSGALRMAVALSRAGREIARATARLEVRGRTGIQVTLLRSCLAAECGEGGPNCLNGECVAEGCLTGAEPACAGFAGCRVDDECPSPSASCLAPRCTTSGACVEVEVGGRCGAGEYCDAARECAPIPAMIAPVDAGAPPGDAGLDGGAAARDAEAPLPDAGLPDTGPPDAGPPDECMLALGTSCATVEAFVKTPMPTRGERLGASVAVDGDTLVVGAPGAPGFGVEEAGAVDIFMADGTGGWRHTQRVARVDGFGGERWGARVALSGDFLVVGSAVSPRVHVVRRVGDAWAVEAELPHVGDDGFGRSLDIDGTRIVVGAPLEDSDALVVDGDESNDDRLDSGAAYVFERVGETWVPVAFLKSPLATAGAAFGADVAIDGGRVVVGSDPSGLASPSVEVFAAGSPWTHEATLQPLRLHSSGDGFGRAVSVSGDLVVVGAPRYGFVGEEIEPGRPDVFEGGAVFVFRFDATRWTEEAIVRASDAGEMDHFGERVALDGDLLAVGVPGEDGTVMRFDGSPDDDLPESGAVILLRRDVGWSQVAYFKGSHAAVGDQAGTSVALDRGLVVVGVSADDSGAVPGDGAEVESGAAYVFRTSLP